MRWMPAIALGAVVLSAGVAAAQQADTGPNRRQPAGERQAGERDVSRRGDSANDQDRMFATCLAIDNTAEIQVAEFAAQRLQDEQAKQFAQQMVRDHRAFLEKLNKFGAEAITLRAASVAPAEVSVRAGRDGQADVKVQADNPAGEERRGERREARAGRREGDHVDFVAIKQEIAEQCVLTAQEELAAKPANEVDRCFMAAQVFGHQHMLDALKVLQRHASPQLKETLAEASQSTEQHLLHAKTILKSLDEKHHANEAPASSGTTSR